MTMAAQPHWRRRRLRRGELRFRVQEDRMNAARFIDFLKALLDSVPGKVFLIVDGHPVHKAKKVREFAGK